MNTLTQPQLKKTLVILALVAVVVLIVSYFAPIAAIAEEIPAEPTDLAGQAQAGVDAVGGPAEDVSFTQTMITVINTMLFAIGILSVVMIIVGGIRYVVSAGDSNGVQGARNTILYAVVGLVVAFVAWGIVNFVSGLFTPDPVKTKPTVLIINHV